jgi:ankyrin repeat protein
VQILPGEDKIRIRVEVTKATGSLEIDSIRVVPSDIMNEATIQQQHLLNQALKSDDPEVIQQLIEAAPHMLEVRTGNCDNGTPLIRSAWDGAPQVAAMLVELGADIEAKDPNWGNTPLRWCSWWGTPDVAEILMEAGAEASGVSAMARSSETNNTFTQRPPEDFDRTAKIIDDHLAKRKSQK